MIASWIRIGLSDFAEYFERVWLNSRECNWFEQFSEYVANNNGLESMNKSIKRVHTLSRKMPFTEFVRLAADIVNHWSKTSQVVGKLLTFTKNSFRSQH